MLSNKIKILYLVLEMDLGGLQRIVNLLIRKINKEQFIPYLCCLDRGGLFYEQLINEQVTTFILHRKTGPFDTKLFLNLFRILRTHKIDIIHSQNGCSSYAALTGRLVGVKGIVHTDHGRLVPDKKSAILEDRISSLFFNHFVAVSDHLRDYLATVVKVSSAKLITIINGVDIDTFKPLPPPARVKLRSELGIGENEIIIGTVCRLDPIKNLEFLIRNMKSICKVIPECKLLIVGDGPSREQLMSYAQASGIKSKVMFLGTKQNIEQMLGAFDLYVCTSLSEGTSMTILEAMACGLPIVASAVGGNPGLVDDSNGSLFPPYDPNLFIKNAIRIINNPPLLKKMGENSRAKVASSFSLNRVVKQYEDLYLSLCQN
jgi:sugar transferase (PEP-CTERM/EpsH1 system associated)